MIFTTNSYYFFIRTKALIILLLISIAPCIAQIKIDGDLTEWGKLDRFDKENNMQYSIRNDEANLYIAISKSDNPEKLVTKSGIEILLDSLVINEKSPTIVFAFDFKVSNNAQFEKIKLLNFPEIKDTVVNLINEFGVQAFAKFHSLSATLPAGQMWAEKPSQIVECEVAIPLDYLKSKSEQINYSFCLRGVDYKKDEAPYKRQLKIITKAQGNLNDSTLGNYKFSEHFGRYQL